MAEWGRPKASGGAGGGLWQRLAAATLPTVLLCALFATLAQAQLPDAAQDPGSANDGLADTDYTPNAKDAEGLWKRVAGAEFDSTRVPADSPTPYTLDLFTVRFDGQSDGLAAGGVCEDPNTAPDDVAACTRVPSLYRYT
jgi:hypothetical protein